MKQKILILLFFCFCLLSNFTIVKASALNSMDQKEKKELFGQVQGMFIHIMENYMKSKKLGLDHQVRIAHCIGEVIDLKEVQPMSIVQIK